LWKLKIPCRNGLRQPYPVIAPEEFDPGIPRPAGPNLEDYRPAVMPPTDLQGGRHIHREMNILPPSGQQAFFLDGGEKTPGSTVIKNLRRKSWFLDNPLGAGVPVERPDLPPGHFKPLLLG
jgi:hypothetical protein